MSRPYGGVTRKALVSPSEISGGAGARIGKRFSTDPLRGKRRWLLPWLSMTKT